MSRKRYERTYNHSSWLRYVPSTLIGMVVGILGFAYLTAGIVYDYRDSIRQNRPLPKVDAIVCLAGGRGRIQAAGELWLRYKKDGEQAVPTLYVSGMGPKANWDVLTRQLSEEVLKEIDENNVYFETVSTDTVGNADLLNKYAIEKGWRRLAIVTSSYHMRRATHIFQRTLDPTKGWMLKTYSVSQTPFNAKDWRSSINSIEVTMTEYFKWIYYYATL